ncbi:hypothetical protein [Brevundimonas sp.]|uniref:hypothetical protein n=1 Tax=Brevundimonas sp. TaxID=1871086 RepID=UPI002737E85A|nr:hypothetical protein [Brevundimonas sp.]MDP3803549.1 hypothetical protein [Brevundimonas sp.]
MSEDTLPILLMIVAFFLTFLMPVGGVSILGRPRLVPQGTPMRRSAGGDDGG